VAYSYNPTLSSDLDKIRFLLGDTVINEMQLLDEEISGLLLMQPAMGQAAAAGAKAIAAKWALHVDNKNSELSVNASQRFEHYMKLAKDLEKRGTDPFSGKTYVSAGVKMGGISITENIELANNKDNIPITFFSGVFQNG